MIGMDATTGKRLEGTAHLVQSIGDILSTPVGTRLRVREYGSALPSLADQPLNGLGLTRVYAAVALAIQRWEPRLKLTRVRLVGANSAALAGGLAQIDLEGIRTDTARPNEFVRLSIPLRPSKS